jgi:SNF family Na+-dependent transporter
VAPHLFGVLFFLMLLTLAVDSAFSLVEAAAASLRDKWGWSHRRSNLTIAAIGCALGVPYVLGFGLYWLDIVDHFINGFGLTSVCLGECIFLGWALKSKKHAPVDPDLCARRAIRWGATAFGAAVVVLFVVSVSLEGFAELGEMVPVILIGGDAIALFVVLAIYTSDHRYVEDLRDYANQQSDFPIGRWWNFLVRYIAPLVLILLIASEVKARVAASYEGYPRLAEFLGGWLILHLVVGLAFLLMFLKGKKESEA